MKLTKEQIQQVEAYIDKKDINYIDIRFEVFDHISTDIENLIENNNYSFEDAFNEVKDKWRNSFKSTSSLWLGWANNSPKLLIEKCVKIYKPLVFKSLFLVILFAALGYSINSNFEYSVANYKDISAHIIFSALILYTGTVLFWYLKIRLEKIKTSYNFLYRKQILPNLFSVIIFNPYLNQSYITKEGKFSLIMFAMLFIFFLTFLGAKYFYKNHLKAISTYKKYQLQ